MPPPDPAPKALRRLAVRTGALYGAVCVALWPVPVLGLLHAESSAVVAGVGCVWAGVGSVGPLLQKIEVQRLARVHLGALAVPLALLTASLLWRPNCGYLQGLGLFAVLVPPSVLFGLGVSSAVVASRARWPRVTVAVLLLAVAVGGAAWALLRHPQLFVYSPVFGGVLGPVYDAELAVRPGLFASAARTVLWALALFAYAEWRGGKGRGAPPTFRPVAGSQADTRSPSRVRGTARAPADRRRQPEERALGRGERPGEGGPSPRLRTSSLLLLSSASLLALVLAAPLGIVQTAGGIEARLSHEIDLGPVVLHLAPETPPAERRRLSAEVLFRFETLAQKLDERPRQPVAVYLYPDPDTKAALIGSRHTSVVPVWLPSPQVHMLADEVPRSLGHEMVHVLAREFGAPVLRASPAVGLVEGLAVAFEPPDGLPSPSALVRAGAAVPEAGLGDPAEAVRATMSPGGFWTSRAGVAYTANGAFTRWLLDTYGLGPLKRAYRTGRFEPAYGVPLDTLAARWAADLGRQPLDAEAVAVARWLFSRPSLFEVRCPHHVSDAVRLARDAGEAWDEGDAAGANAAFERAAQADPFALAALAGRVQTRLALGRRLDGDLALAQARADSVADAGALVHLADVLALAGDAARAQATYRAASDSLAPVDAVGRVLLARRAALDAETRRQWLAAPPDSVPPLVAARAPVLSALRHRQSDRPAQAWAAVRRWCGGRDEGGIGRDGGMRDGGAHPSIPPPVLRLLAARIAVDAGALDAAAALADGLDGAFERGGSGSLAPVARDLVERVDWHRRRGGPPIIFGAPPPVADAAPPCLLPGRPAAGGRLRGP